MGFSGGKHITTINPVRRGWRGEIWTEGGDGERQEAVKERGRGERGVKWKAGEPLQRKRGGVEIGGGKAFQC